MTHFDLTQVNWATAWVLNSLTCWYVTESSPAGGHVVLLRLQPLDYSCNYQSASKAMQL